MINLSFVTGVKDVDAKWIGWAGVNVPDEVGQRALTRALAEKVCPNFNAFLLYYYLVSVLSSRSSIES